MQAQQIQDDRPQALIDDMIEAEKYRAAQIARAAELGIPLVPLPKLVKTPETHPCADCGAEGVHRFLRWCRPCGEARSERERAVRDAEQLMAMAELRRENAELRRDLHLVEIERATLRTMVERFEPSIE